MYHPNEPGVWVPSPEEIAKACEEYARQRLAGEVPMKREGKPMYVGDSSSPGIRNYYSSEVGSQTIFTPGEVL